MAGEAEVGSIIGYLRLDRSDWDAELTAAGRKADDLARHNPDIRIRTNAPSAIAQLAAVAAATKRLQDAQGAESVAEARLQSLRDRGITNAGRLRAAEEAVAKARRSEAAALIALAAAQDANDRAMQKATADTDKLAKKANEAKNTFKIGLIPALAAIAPAAVPIAAVAGGALIGLAPVAATVMLAVKGIENQMKAGALQGTQFAASVNALKGELTTLEQTAAGGIMVGLNKAMSESAPLFHTVNQDVGVMSAQLGNIVAGAAPALLRILTDLNPLFVTFGNLLVRGAEHLDHWAQTSNGVSHFVAYVQAELPTVEQLLGNVIVLFSHLAQAAAPFGGVVLSDINLLVHALDAIPVPVLRAAVPVVVALYAAFKTYGAVTAIVKNVNTALTAHAAAVTADAATTARASRTSTLAAWDEYTQVAEAKAREAQAAAEATAAMVESSDGMDSLFQSEAVTAARAAEEITASWEGVASLFATDANLIAEAAAREAAAFRATAIAAATSAEEVAASADSAAAESSLAGRIAGSGWLAMLGPVGAIAAGVGIMTSLFGSSGQAAQQAAANVNTLTQALEQDNNAIGENTRLAVLNILQQEGVTRTAHALGIGINTLVDAALGQGNAMGVVNAALAANPPQSMAAAKAQSTLYNALTGNNGQMKTAIQNAKDHAAVQAADTAAIKANTKSTQVQAATTKQYASAIGAVNTALQTYYDTVLANAATEDQFLLGLKQVGSQIKTNGTSLSENTANGLQNRTMLISLLQAAEAAAKTSNNYTAALEGNVQQFEQSAIHAGFSKKAVEALIAQMHLTPKDIETRFLADATPAMRALLALQNYIKTHTWDVTVRVNASGQKMGYVPGVGYTQVANPPAHKAAGRYIPGLGYVPGHAAGTASSSPGWFWVGERGPELMRFRGGEQVMPNSVAMRYAQTRTAPPSDSTVGGATTVINQTINPQPGQSEREIGRAAGDEIAWALAR